MRLVKSWNVDMNKDDSYFSELQAKILELQQAVSGLASKLTSEEKALLDTRAAAQLEEFYNGPEQPVSPKEVKKAQRWTDPEGKLVLVKLDKALIVTELCFMSQTSDLDVKNGEKILLLVKKLREHIAVYQEKRDLVQFEKNVNKTLRDPAYVLSSNKFLIQLHDAIIYLFRAFFRLFDYLITSSVRSPELMRDSGTPGAKLLTGRSNFFEYYKTAEYKKLSKDFAEGVTELKARATAGDEHDVRPG
jgi:hypothetical protein